MYLNYWAICAAAIAAQVIGFAWYAQKSLGGIWMKQLEPSTLEKMKKWNKERNMAPTMIVSLISSFVMAYVLAYIMQYMFEEKTVMIGLKTAFWSWLGFMMPISLGTVLWEMKSVKYFLINTSYYLVTLLVMGAILGTWR